MLVTWGLTAGIFAEAPVVRLVQSTAVWLALALMMLAAVVLFSCRMSTLAALAAGVALFAVLGILTLWGPALRYTPAGLLGAPTQILAGESASLASPLVTTAAATLLLIAAATRVFRRVEI